MRFADIDKQIKTKLKTTASPDLDQRIDTLITRAEKTQTQTSNKWRTIMNTKTAKLATAAVFVAVAILSVNLFDKTTTPAWAIEDTINALENIYSIKMSGLVTHEKTGTEIEYVLWAKPNEDGTESGELCFEVPDQQIIIVTQSGTTYRYHPGPNLVDVKEYRDFSLNPWLGSDFFHTMKRFAENWEVSYGKDEETDRESVFATCTYTPELKSWWIQFDAETRLPVRFKQWTNMNFEGKPQFYAASIEYNPELPAGIFEFEIPEGAKVTKVPQKLPECLDDPSAGTSTEDLTDEEASLVTVEDYLRALIDGDWEYLAQLRPICDAENWELRYKHSNNWPIKVLEIGQPYQEARCKIGPVVPCKVKYSDDQIKNIKYVVKIRNIDGIRSCVIAGTYDSVKEF